MKLTKINRPIIDFFGDEIPYLNESGVKSPLSYKKAMILALLNSPKQGGDSDEEKYKKFELAKKIAGAEEELELESPEQSLIRSCAATAWNVLVFGLVRDFVEGKDV